MHEGTVGYNQNAETFIRDTLTVDISPLYGRLLPGLSAYEYILYAAADRVVTPRHVSGDGIRHSL